MSTPPGKKGFLIGLLRDWGMAFGIVIAVFVVWNWMFATDPVTAGPAPDFTLNDLDGSEWQLSAVDSELVVLNFWFTTCPPCRREIPELARWHTDHPEVTLLGISTDVGMPTRQLAVISKRLGINYTVLHDVQAEVARKYGVDVFPTTLVIRDGHIGAVKVGGLEYATLDQLVAATR